MKSFVLAGLAIGGAMGTSVLFEGHASACGACMHEPPPPNPPPNQVDTQVTGHRMAFAISTLQTVLWDQISYSGNPKEFAWVLPVRQGTRVELSNDAWLAALDASTATVIEPPPVPSCPPQNPVGGGGGYGYGDRVPSDQGCGGGGAMCAGTSSEEAFAGGGDDGGSAADAGVAHNTPPPPPPVQVQTQEVVGPYDVVIIHSSQGAALDAWLLANGFEVPKGLQPTIDAYVKEGFDFVALKLAPGANERAMQPVRVVEPGADPSLPLRMVAGGVGANVALELTVIGEGRYHPQNFPDVAVDESKLTYSVSGYESNYETLAMQAMATGTGKGWLTEFAGPAPLYPGENTPALHTAYQQSCMPTQGTTCDGGASDDAGPDAADDASPAVDAAAEAADDGAASSDGAPADAAGPDGAMSAEGGTCTPTMGSSCDDLDVAFMGFFSPGDIWITRMRANLPASALATDMILEAAPIQAQVSNLHRAQTWVGDPCTLTLVVPRGNLGAPVGSAQSCALGSKRRTQDSAGSAFLVAATALAIAWMKRKKKRV